MYRSCIQDHSRQASDKHVANQGQRASEYKIGFDPPPLRKVPVPSKRISLSGGRDAGDEKNGTPNTDALRRKWISIHVARFTQQSPPNLISSFPSLPVRHTHIMIVVSFLALGPSPKRRALVPLTKQNRTMRQDRPQQYQRRTRRRS